MNVRMHNKHITVSKRKTHRRLNNYPSWILNDAPPSDQNTAFCTCFHLLERVSPRAKEAPNKVVLKKRVITASQKKSDSRINLTMGPK